MRLKETKDAELVRSSVPIAGENDGYVDAKQIADHLIAKKTVVLNLETASSENKRRIIDFLVGVAYANGGSLKPVANLTYIITPYNVGFQGEELVGELENNGMI